MGYPRMRKAAQWRLRGIELANRFGAVLWLIASFMGFLTYTSSQGTQGGELIFGPLAILFTLLAFIIGGVPWKL